MTGSDSEGDAAVSLADFATFRQEMANEVGQVRVALQKAVTEVLEVVRQPVPGGGAGGIGRLESQPGTPAAGASAALLGQPSGSPVAGVPSFAGGPAGVGTLGQPFGTPAAGVLPPTSGITGHTVGGAAGAYAGLS